MQNLQGREYDVFPSLLKKAKERGPVKVAVAQPTDSSSLSGVLDSYKEGLIDPILVGDREKIESCAKSEGFDISNFEIVHALDDLDAAKKTAEFATKGVVKALMKGNLHTNDIMSAIIRREANLRTDRIISHVFVMDVPAYHKALLITDAAINIAPDLKAKISLIKNSVDFAHSIGIQKPKVALLSAVEMPYDKLPSSLEADEITKIAKDEIKDAIVYGPLAFDNAISKVSAKIKKIDSEVCGDPDILLVPQIESGNILFKSLIYLAYAKVAGIVVGAKIPVILTSRSDDTEARVASSALAVLSTN